MNKIAAIDIGLGGEECAVSGLARTVLFLFAVTVPLDVVPITGTTSLTFYAGLLLAAAGAWQMATSGRLRSAPVSVLLLTGYTAWALASVLWAHDTDDALRRVAVNAMLLASLWLGWQVAVGRRDVKLIAAGYILGCVIAAAGAWQAFLTGTAYSTYQERYAGMGYDPNDMGVTLSLAMPMAAYLATTGTGRRAFLWLVYLPVGVSAIILSGSRGAALTAVLAIGCVTLWVARRSRFVTVLILAVLAGAVVVVAIRTPETLERVFTIREQLAGGGNLGHRRTIWAAGMRVFADHPLLGIGTGQFSSGVANELGYSMVAHNAFVSVLVELGIPGLLLFAGAFATLAYGARSLPRNDRLLVLTLLATWFVGVSSLTWELRKATWLAVLLCAVVNQLARDGSPAREAPLAGPAAPAASPTP